MFSGQKKREVIFKSINLGYIVWGQYHSIYSQRVYKEKKISRFKFGSETNTESNSEVSD